MHAGVKRLGEKQRGTAVAQTGHGQVGEYTQRRTVHTQGEQILRIPGSRQTAEYVHTRKRSQRRDADGPG